MVAAQAEMERHGVVCIERTGSDIEQHLDARVHKATIVCVVQLSWLYTWDHTKT